MASSMRNFAAGGAILAFQDGPGENFLPGLFAVALWRENAYILRPFEGRDGTTDVPSGHAILDV